MYIFHPQWLVQREVIPEGTEIGIETNLTQPGFRFRLPKFQATLHVAPTQLVVESQDPSFDCGEVVAKALAKLPETPVFALGNNAFYKADPSELENLSAAIRDFPRTGSPAAGERAAQWTFHVGVKQGEHAAVNLQLSITEESVELACNSHTGLESLSDANAAAVAAAERFVEDIARSRALAHHFFGASVHDDSNHS